MKILVPYDGSPPSTRAVEYALRIATAVGKPTVDMHLLNVQEADPAVIAVDAVHGVEAGGPFLHRHLQRRQVGRMEMGVDQRDAVNHWRPRST